MTTLVGTVGMYVTRLTALMAAAYNFVSYHLSQPAVEYEVFTFEFIRQLLLLHPIGIINNSTLEMENIFKAIMEHPRACFFTPDTPGAIHDNVFILLSFKHTNGHG